MGKAFILLMLGAVVWFGKRGFSSPDLPAQTIDRILVLILISNFVLYMLNERLAASGRFPIHVLKNNLVKTGNDYLLHKQNKPVDANT